MRNFEQEQEEIRLAVTQYFNEEHEILKEEINEKLKNKNLSYRHKQYLYKCKSKNRAFELTSEEFENIITQNCHYCGQTGHGIDRIDSSKGYTKTNTVPCCTKCNMMKHTYSQDDFLSHIKKIYEFNSNDN